MRSRPRLVAVLCCLVLSACSQHSGPTALPPISTAFSRETVSVPDVGSFSPLYPFGKNPNDGSQPTFLVPFNGVLYGTTTNGGASNEGIVFSVTPAGKETILHSFAVTDGAEPVGPLYNVGGLFFGTTISGGGPSSLGEVFTIDPGNGNFNVLYRFQGGSSDGSQPYGGLVGLNGKLYGTTSGGGTNGEGTVFSITTGGVEHVIHSFSLAATDGAQPMSTLIVVNGALYGTTLGGGKFGEGTIFRVSTAGNVKVVHSFGKGKDGRIPYFGALIALNDMLYGTTLQGGDKGIGTVFSSSLTGAETVLYSFRGTAATGCEPWAGLVYLNGTLYGTSVGGSTPSCVSEGTLFSVNPGGGATTIHKFAGGRGGNAPVGLAPMGADLYGVTAGGGLFNQGLFYMVAP